ncbi:hypothetical protein FHG87_014178 [Trinorchestia longiramus]|nr:hypothetical protein FHG87_014178 [Trinorchestia longiramus]
MSELQAIASTLSQDIIAVNETWLNSQWKTSPSHKWIRSYRQDRRPPDFTLEVQDPNSRTQHKQVLDHKRVNFELMKEELGSNNYEVLMSNKNAEECYMILKEKIATATEHHIPRKQIRPTNNPPWFSQEIKRLINVRRQSYRRL